MNNSIHVCILTSAHPIDDVRVSHKIGQAFRSHGFRVSWVGPDHTFFDAHKYDRYGMKYHLFPAGKGKFGRLSNFYKVYFKGLSIPDVDVFYAPDPDSAAAAVWLAKKNHARVIFDIHEIFHDAMLDRWLKGPVVKFAKSILQYLILSVCSNCDLVIGVSGAVLAPYESVSTEKMVVRSCAPAWFADGDPADVCAPDRKTFTFMHGKANMSRGTDVVLEALSRAKQQICGLKCIMFDTFQGSLESVEGNDFSRKLVELNLQDVVELRKGVPMQEMPGIVRSCDAGLIAYGRKLGMESLPNKLFEYMAAGLPIIAPSYSPEICQIIESEQCGLTVDFENPVAVAETMINLYQKPEDCREMGRKGREAFEKRLNWQVEVQPLLARIHDWSS